MNYQYPSFKNNQIYSPQISSSMIYHSNTPQQPQILTNSVIVPPTINNNYFNKSDININENP